MKVVCRRIYYRKIEYWIKKAYNSTYVWTACPKWNGTERMVIMATQVSIETTYITLGQLLKEENIVATGGQSKWYLRENEVLVNQEHDDRRGRKLYPGDIVALPTGERFIINGTGVEAE